MTGIPQELRSRIRIDGGFVDGDREDSIDGFSMYEFLDDIWDGSIKFQNALREYFQANDLVHVIYQPLGNFARPEIQTLFLDPYAEAI